MYISKRDVYKRAFGCPTALLILSNTGIKTNELLQVTAALQANDYQQKFH
jgi:hypothetical protein